MRSSARASRPVSVRSQPVTVEVKPLPTEGRPRDYDGAVGEYRLDAELSRDSVSAGDPVTLTLSIEGRGNLRSVDLPELPDTPGFRTFDPKTDEQLRATASGVRGEKRWEYVLVPESGGTKEIGPWSFEYFDPSQEKYVSATVGPLKLNVSGTAAASSGGDVPVMTPRGEVRLLREDIRYLKDPPATLGVSARPFYESTLFYLTLILPVVWNLGLVAYLKRKEQERTHSSLFRSRRAHRMARGRLKSARKLAADGSKSFYEEAAAALYRYIGDKKSVSPSGLTTQSIDGILDASGVTDELRAEFRDVLSKCEEARFTPGDRSREEMEALAARVEELIVSLDRKL